MAAETPNPVRFAIGDEEFDLPDPLELTIDEWIIAWDYGEFILEDFAPIADDKKAEAERQRRLKSPMLMKALFHIGYMRAHADADQDKVREMIGAGQMINLLESMSGGEEPEEEENPTPASELERSSSRSSDGSNGDSPSPSAKSSDEQDSEPATTGTSG